MNKKLHIQDLSTFSLSDILTMANYFDINHRLATSKVIDQLADKILAKYHKAQMLPQKEDLQQLYKRFRRVIEDMTENEQLQKFGRKIENIEELSLQKLEYFKHRFGREIEDMTREEQQWMFGREIQNIEELSLQELKLAATVFWELIAPYSRMQIEKRSSRQRRQQS